MSEISKGGSRLAWVDQMRTMVIVLVVNMHACVTYGHVGSWYVNEPPDPPLVIKLVFLLWQGHLQAFFMGLLFFVSGYFAWGSLGRRGPGRFMRERLVRLGLPTLLYMLVLNPLILFVINAGGNDWGPLGKAYAGYLSRGWFLSGTGPMWFAEALLLFSGALALAWQARPALTAPGASGAPGAGGLWVFGATLVAATFLVRLVQPLGSSVQNLQLCYFPQYVLAFGAGAAAARGGWLVTLARSRAARRAGWLALFLGPLALAAVLLGGGIWKGQSLVPFSGGWNWRTFGLAAWEQLAGLGLGLGALAFCSGKLNEDTKLARWLNDRSFGVYLFHPIPLILITIGLRPLDINPFFKVSLLTGACLVASFAVADLARRIPGLRAIV